MIKLSVIIPTRNRSALLEKALISLSKQTFNPDNFEVLVIDNASTDNTKNLVESYKNKIKYIKYFYEGTFGLHAGRHRGLKEATSDILVYGDDDIEAFQDWLEAIWESFQEEEVVLVGGKNLPNYESEPPYWIESLWEYNEYGKTSGYFSILDFGNNIKEINPNFVYGCNFSIRKNILLQAGGFHPDGMPRERIVYRGDGESHVSNYILNNKLKTIYNPRASVYHFVSTKRMTLEYIYNRAFMQGISNSFKDLKNDFKIDKPIIKIEKKENFIKKGLKKIKNVIINNEIKSLNFKIDFLENEIESIKKYLSIENNYKLIINIGIFDGYSFHQNEYKINKELKDWINRDNYF